MTVARYRTLLVGTVLTLTAISPVAQMSIQLLRLYEASQPARSTSVPE